MTVRPSTGGVTDVTAALDLVLDLGPGRLDPADLAALAGLRRRVDERLAHGDGLTVVAVAGGTGVGKSALVNRLAGDHVVEEGVTRPTTEHATAVSATHDEAVGALLDWLEVPRRRHAAALPDGLVLLDLPDHDSVVDLHQQVADRLTGRVDALVVVVDPVKYARADLHRGLLARLAAHADVLTVVLNHADELDADGLQRCLDDLAARLVGSGIGYDRLLATSATTGAGLDELRGQLHELAGRRQAAVRRLTGDAAQLAHEVLGRLPAPPARSTVEAGRLVAPLLEATDAHRVPVEAEAAYRRDARARTRSPAARVLGAPLRRLARAVPAVAGAGHAPASHRGSAEQLGRILADGLRLDDTVGAAHVALARDVHDVAVTAAPAIARVVDHVPIRPAQRAWWAASSWLRGLTELSAAVGLAWLALVGVVRWLQLPDLPVPQLTDRLSWPAALLLYGVVARVLLGLLTHGLIVLGGRRHHRRTRRSLHDQVASAVDDHLLRPYRERLDQQHRLHDGLTRLAATTSR